MQLYQQRATWGIPSTGMYSRYQFHHPGPALYAWVAPFWNAWGGRGTLVAAALLNCICLTLILWVLHHRGGTPLLAIGAGVLATLEVGIVADFISPWNPWAALLPFLLCMLLAWSAWCGDAWALPAYVAAISITVQFHIGFAIIGVVMLIFVGIGVWRHRTDSTLRTALMWSGGISALIWAAPVIQQFSTNPGNFTKIVRAFRTPEDPLVGWDIALASSRQAIAFLPPWLTGVSHDLSANPIAPSWWSALLFPLLLLLALVLSIRLRRPGLRSLLIGVIIGHGIALTSVARIQGGAFPYLIRWIWMIAALGWIAVIWTFWLCTPWARHSNAGVASVAIRRWGWFSAAVLVVVPTGFAVQQGFAATVPDPWGSEMIAHTVDDLAAALTPDDVLAFQYESPGLVHAGTGLMTEMERRGFTVWGPDEYWIPYGTDRVLGDHHATKQVTVVTAGEDIQQHLDRGETPVAHWDPLTPSERSELTELNAKVAALFAGTLDPSKFSHREHTRAQELSNRGLPIAIFVDQLPNANPKSGAPNTGA